MIKSLLSLLLMTFTLSSFAMDPDKDPADDFGKLTLGAPEGLVTLPTEGHLGLSSWNFVKDLHTLRSATRTPGTMHYTTITDGFLGLKQTSNVQVTTDTLAALKRLQANLKGYVIIIGLGHIDAGQKGRMEKYIRNKLSKKHHVKGAQLDHDVAAFVGDPTSGKQVVAFPYPDSGALKLPFSAGELETFNPKILTAAPTTASRTFFAAAAEAGFRKVNAFTIALK